MPGDWSGSSPRKEYGPSRTNMQDNWRRHRDNSGDEDGWRSTSSQHVTRDKWSGPGTAGGSRSGNWRGEGEREERETRTWHASSDHNRVAPHRRPWDNEDHLPEWATENPSESGGTFDASGAFHGSDEENDRQQKSRNREQPPLHKSASQHNIISPKKPPPLATSQSAVNLAKSNEEAKTESQQNDVTTTITEPSPKVPTPPLEKIEPEPEKPPEDAQKPDEPKKRPVDDDFDHMKEVTDDIVAKLIDDDLPKRPDVPYPGLGLPGAAIPPPGNIGIDKWYYCDPQGETQGPFSAQEMAEWYRAGYFTVGLMVRRQCDERFFTLGDLVKQCPGGVPFLTCRLPPLKNEPAIPIPKPADSETLLQQQLHLQRILQRQAETIRALSQTEPWAQLSTLQQRELISQHMLQQSSTMLSDIPYVPQIQNTQMTNPLMHMISQMQQASKLTAQLPEKPPSTSAQLDPFHQLVQQMGGTLQQNMPDPTPSDKNDHIKNILRQLSGKQTMETMWPGSAAPPFQPPIPQPPPQQWQPPPPLPTSLWDFNAVNNIQSAVPDTAPVSEGVEKEKKLEAEKEAKVRERKEAAEKERKKKEMEQQEKARLVKEAEEKRKEEQRKKEAEKKVELERQRREEERIRKELEKAKREAEEKRMRELEEKRRLKEQRKAEEEARRRQEEERQKAEEEAARRRQEEERQRQKEEVGRKQQEALRKMQEQQRVSKVAPWASLPTPGAGTIAPQPASLSLAEIQRIEREKKAEQAAIIAQQQRAMAAAREALEVQQQQERQLGWAMKKPTQPKKVKSLAEIQAEEQEKQQRLQAEQRLREQTAAVPTVVPSAGIWGTASQNLTWASNQQWQNSGGFWEDAGAQGKAQVKPPQNVKVQAPKPVANNSAPVVKISKAKKEEQQVMKHFDKSSANDEFNAWCMKTLATFNGEVDSEYFFFFNQLVVDFSIFPFFFS